MKKLLGKNYITTQEIAEQLEYHVHTIRKWCVNGIIPAKKFNKEWLILEEDYQAFLKERLGQNDPEKG